MTTRTGNMPPVIQHPAPGTQTSNEFGRVISTRPSASPSAPPPSGNLAPTCDRYGNIISVPKGYEPPSAPIPGTNFVPDADGVIDWK